jgi:hypothetical protein
MDALVERIAEQAEKDATARAAKIAETWESTLFPRGVPVEYAQHQEITNQIGPSIAEAIRESPRPAPEPDPKEGR